MAPNSATSSVQHVLLAREEVFDAQAIQTGLYDSKPWCFQIVENLTLARLSASIPSKILSFQYTPKF